MSSGIDFIEEYDDPNSDIIKMVGEIAGGASIADYAKAKKSKTPSGKTFCYASIDTNVLGYLVEAATGRNPASYLEEKIWRQIGTEYDATWATDNHGSVLTFAFSTSRCATTPNSGACSCAKATGKGGKSSPRNGSTTRRIQAKSTSN